MQTSVGLSVLASGRSFGHCLKAGCLALVTALTIANHAANAITVPNVEQMGSEASVMADTLSRQGAPPREVGFPAGCAADPAASCAAQATALAGFNPLVSAFSTTSGSSNPNQATADLTYFFQVLGPSTNSVPLFIAGKITSSPTVNAVHNGQVGFDQSVASNYLEILDCGAFVCQNTPQAFIQGSLAFAISSSTVIAGNPIRSGVFSNTFSVVPETLYAIYMHVDAFTTDSFGTETATSDIDPVITIDPSFADANQYQLEFSEGVLSSPSAVPLPTALPLFATGLGGLGLLVRRKRKARAGA